MDSEGCVVGFFIDWRGDTPVRFQVWAIATQSLTGWREMLAAYRAHLWRRLRGLALWLAGGVP